MPEPENGKQMEQKINDLVKELEDQIVDLSQQIGDSPIDQLVAEKESLALALGTKEAEIEGLKAQVKQLSEKSSQLSDNNGKLQDDNRDLRRKNNNQQEDINLLRSANENSAKLIEGVKGKLEHLLGLADIAFSMELEAIPEAPLSVEEVGKYKGMFVCCGESQHRKNNLRRFESLVRATPQVDWGEGPHFVLKDSQRPPIPAGMHLVLFFARGLSHPDIDALKYSAKLAGVHTATHTNIAPLVQIVSEWLKNPDFGMVGSSYPGGGAAH